MKKLLCALLIASLLSGCGQKKDVYSKTCSMKEEGVVMEVTSLAPDENADVETLTLSVSTSYESLGMTKEQLTSQLKLLGMTEDDMIKSLESTFLESFGFDNGVTIKTNEFNDEGYILVAELDIKAAAEALGGTNEDLSTAAFTEEFSKLGFTCK